MLHFSRRQVLSIPMAASVAGVGAGAASAAQSESAVPDFDAIEDRMTRMADRGSSLTLRQKHLAVLAVVCGLGIADAAEREAASAMADGLSPADVEEAVFQSAPYAGMAGAREAMKGVHAAMAAAGVKVPLESRTAVTDEDRLEKGIAVQTEIFGDVITRMHESVPEARRPLMIGDLSGWCFGDFYTRRGLTIAERELVTFCTIAALGGCEPQLSAHGAANVKWGNSKENLIDALQCAVAYLGFPRTLNACAVVDKLA